MLAHASWAVDAARRAGRPWHEDETWAGGVLGGRAAMTNWVVPKQPVDPAGHPPLMARLPQTRTDPPTTDLDIRRVDDADTLADAERVLVEGYPLPELQPFKAGALLDPSSLDGPSTYWVGYDGDVPLATATAHDAAGVTVVENVAAMPGARGRGAGAAVTWAATTHRPDPVAVLIASDSGQPLYERLDYVRIERWTVWVRS